MGFTHLLFIMKIIPHTNIVINGQHCPAGIAVEVELRLALELVAQNIAAPTAMVADVEHATARPVVEQPETRKKARKS